MPEFCVFGRTKELVENEQMSKTKAIVQSWKEFFEILEGRDGSDG